MKKNINLTSPDYEEKVWHCSKDVGAVEMTPSNPQWIPPNTSSSLPDKVNFQFCVYYHESPRQGLSHPQCCWSDDGSPSIQASKHKSETAYNPLKTMNLSQLQRYQWKSLNLHCFSTFLLKFMWFTRNDLAQGSPKVYVRGPPKLIQNMSRAGRLT